MQLKKRIFTVVAVVTAGALLSGCSLKEKVQNMVGSDERYPAVSVSPVTTMEVESNDVVATPEPTQSSSSEVKDLELDLKVVKFDQESFE